MIQKEDDTVVLLSSEERQAEEQISTKCDRKRSFIASSFGASCLCGAGLFMSSVAVWCNDPKLSCRDKEIMRLSTLLGGITAAFISGRTIDFYGRRKCLALSVICWLFATILLVLAPTSTMNADSASAISSNVITTYRSSSVDVTTTYVINSIEKQSSPQSLSPHLGNHLPATQPSPIQSISFQSNSRHINLPRHLYNFGNSSREILSSWKNDSVNYQSKIIDSDGQSSSVSFIVVTYLFIGAASTSSIISASVYVFETSKMDFRARCLSLSDLFSGVFALFIPFIHAYTFILTLVACIPVIILCILSLFPFKIPSVMSLPCSPYYLLMLSKRKQLLTKSIWLDVDDSLSKDDKKISSDRDCKVKSSINSFSFNGKAAFRVSNRFKTPLNSSKNKIYDSRKSSSGDSDDSSSCVNDFVKHAELETDLEKLLSGPNENSSWADSVQYRKTLYEEGDELFFCECSEAVAMTGEGLDGGILNDFDVDITNIENEDGSVISFDTGKGTIEQPYLRNAQSENDDCVVDEQNDIASIEVRPSRSVEQKVTPEEAEALRILVLLYGSRKGQEEWEANRKMEDIDSNRSSFCTVDLKNFGPTVKNVFRIGLPLIIIHLCARDIGGTIAICETIMSKINFCDVSAQTVVLSLQVISAGIAVLVLDKLHNHVVLLSASMVMATSLMALGILSPQLNPMVENTHSNGFVDSTTPIPPPITTLYPLLPTPLPQVLENESVKCLRNQWNDFSSCMLNHPEGSLNHHDYIASETPVIWLTVVSMVSSLIAGSLILIPLTRLILLSSFPISVRGNGVGISFAIQYIIQLAVFFLPYTLHNFRLGFIFRAGACFSSIIMLLCFLGKTHPSQCLHLHYNGYNKRFFHLLSDGRVRNLSTSNSTAV